MLLSVCISTRRCIVARSVLQRLAGVPSRLLRALLRPSEQSSSQGGGDPSFLNARRAGAAARYSAGYLFGNRWNC